MLRQQLREGVDSFTALTTPQRALVVLVALLLPVVLALAEELPPWAVSLSAWS